MKWYKTTKPKKNVLGHKHFYKLNVDFFSTDSQFYLIIN